MSCVTGSDFKNFFISFLASVSVLGLLYLAYLISTWLIFNERTSVEFILPTWRIFNKRISVKLKIPAWLISKRIVGDECWWLPDWNCWRLVVRNISGKVPKCAIRYRVWLRQIVLASSGSTVKSFIDQDIACGDRLILPVGQDLPMACFRLEEINKDLYFVETDKFGVEQKRLSLGGIDSLCFEYTFRVRFWLVLKYEVYRTKVWFRFLETKGRDFFYEYILKLQVGGEKQLIGFIKYSEEISVSA